ncbi:MAG: tRNA uridine-5-carboxymethylaminomethyl(34) synthesis GTPase MnmE [Spirochaetes bacterium RBG_13_51_14]|nr:MAG: tRNA uridine-5-carboxymethylaminomethyl(34) synthesis GTPase MnmE [Spirochaetes bacterium RBG_13_51_14]
MLDETICAPSTPPVNSPIAIIRISGSDTYRAISSLFRTSGELKPRHAHYGTLADHNGPVDDAVVIYYRSPQSYTGEDMAEILCHGNPIIVRKILILLNNRGVRMAEPGEFTKRAFLNGKVDLTEAEAINHIITAKSEWEIETSLRQMHGSLRSIIQDIRRRIIELMADIEAGIDFSDEEIDVISPEAALTAVERIRASIEDLMNRCKTGERLSHGIDVAITGKPNVGKSSILNLLLNQERAIVSSIPGTTRDIIREPLQIGGMYVNLIDTAGIDTPGDELERIGIDLSHRKIESSHFIIVVLDASVGMSGADRTILGKTENKKRVILINKIDIARPGDIAGMQSALPEEAILFSAVTGEGMQNLKDTVSRRLKVEFVEMENSFIADMRIISLLEQSVEIVKRTAGLIIGREPGEIISFELRALIDVLSEITGEITPEHILDSVFNRFCIGK